MAHTVKVINGKAPSGGVGGVSDADLSNVAVNFLTSGVATPTAYLPEQQAPMRAKLDALLGRPPDFTYPTDQVDAWHIRP